MIIDPYKDKVAIRGTIIFKGDADINSILAKADHFGSKYFCPEGNLDISVGDYNASGSKEKMIQFWGKDLVYSKEQMFNLYNALKKFDDLMISGCVKFLNNETWNTWQHSYIGEGHWIETEGYITYDEPVSDLCEKMELKEKNI